MKKKLFDENVIYEEKFTGYYYPECSSMKIIDGKNPLVICTNYFTLSAEPEKITSYKFNEEGIEKIKNLIDNAKYLFNDAPLEESGYVVLDGSKEEYFFRSGDKEARIEEDNFSLEYPEIAKDTKAGEILGIITSIYEILKENGIDMDDPNKDVDIDDVDQ